MLLKLLDGTKMMRKDIGLLKIHGEKPGEKMDLFISLMVKNLFILKNSSLLLIQYRKELKKKLLMKLKLPKKKLKWLILMHLLKNLNEKIQFMILYIS